MPAYSSHALNLAPRFDMENFLIASEERRLDGATMQRLMLRWEAWQEHAHARVIDADGARYALVWLDGAVEHEVDTAWKDSPSEGFLLNVLAEMLIAELIAEIVPDVAQFGCAPSPEVGAALGAALSAEGLPWSEAGLGRRYAVLTAADFSGGCAACRLEPDCPKRRTLDGRTLVLGK